MDILCPFGFVGVHVGVGNYSSANEDQYKDVCKDACLKAVASLKNGKSALDAVAVALAVLEESPCTNAGLGSNLNINGEVECDASVMDGKTLSFGAVGAVKGIKSPSQAAYQLLKEECQGVYSAGLVPPIFLVGEGAMGWSKCHSIETVPPESLITDRSRSAYEKNRAKLCDEAAEINEDIPKKKHRLDDLCFKNDGFMDTIGVVCIDMNGSVSAGASSGGMLLKTPGRVGQAAVYGSGCWARNDVEISAACCTTGCGEYLIKTMLAKECAELAMTRDGTNAVHDALQEKFLDSSFLSNDKRQKFAGVVLLRATGKSDQEVEFVWGHNSSSLCVGYMSTDHHKPKVHISRSSSFNYHKHNPILIEGVIHKTNSK